MNSNCSTMMKQNSNKCSQIESPLVPHPSQFTSILTIQLFFFMGLRKHQCILGKLAYTSVVTTIANCDCVLYLPLCWTFILLNPDHCLIIDITLPFLRSVGSVVNETMAGRCAALHWYGRVLFWDDKEPIDWLKTCWENKRVLLLIQWTKNTIHGVSLLITLRYFMGYV